LVELAGRPLVCWCLDAFAAAESVAGAVIAAPRGREDELAALAPGGLAVEAVAGGASRSESIAAALAHADAELIAVHDAARPLVTPELIEVLVARLVSAPDAAGVIAAAPITDTVKRVAGDQRAIAATESRDQLWAAQTPQVFRADALREAHAADPQRLAAATDDATLVEGVGGKVLIEPAPAENLKVTTRADLRLAELLLAERRRG
jgi:2-C-methyl-D-erythritol 4-phosphate cytidylyltransferase